MARPGSSIFRLTLFPLFLASITFATIVLAFPRAAAAQQMRGVAVEGYITAVNPPNGFDVNGQRVLTQSDTTFGLVADKVVSSDGPMRDAVQVGGFVFVSGEFKGSPRP